MVEVWAGGGTDGAVTLVNESMTLRYHCGAVLAVLYGFWGLAAGVAAAAEQHDGNVGQSVAHPLSRFDLRARYMAFEGDSEAEVVEARLEHPLSLAGGWTLNTRVVVAGWVSDLASQDNRNGDYSAGIGDLYTQLFFIAPTLGETTIGFGLRNNFPTASADQFGRGKYRVTPMLVIQRSANWLTKGSFYGLGIRNEFSIAGDRAHRQINELQLVPLLTVLLPHQSFVTLFPEIIIDWEQDNRVFVPLDLEVGRKYAANQAASVRMQLPLLNDLHNYEWTMELRWSLFF